MAIEAYTRRLEGFLEVVSACSSIRDIDPLIRLLAHRSRYLLDFERFSILLCDDSRQIVKTIVIQNGYSREVSLDEILLSEMSLILQTFLTGRSSEEAVGLCTPMVSAGRLVGVICLAAKSERYTDREVRLVRFLADTLAGTFERIARGGTIGSPAGNVASEPSEPSETGGQDVSVVQTNAVSLRMAFLAQHDELTGLANRCLLYERLSRALALTRRHSRRLAVLFLDLDRFKTINDSLGHAAGDQVLRHVSDRLVSCVRSSDTVSRMGGDEFVILLAELDDEDAAAICAQKIIAAVIAPIRIGSNELRIGVSIGISVYPGNGEDADTLVRCADIAMYRAKSEGSGKYCFFEQPMSAAACSQVIVEERLRRSQLPQKVYSLSI